MYTLLGDVDFSDRKTETIRPSGRKLYDQMRIHTNLKRSYPGPYFKLTIILIRNPRPHLKKTLFLIVKLPQSLFGTDHAVK